MYKKYGFTLIEVLVVVAILALLVIGSISLLQGNRTKAEDSQVKSDLSRLKIAFEDYYNDHNCYPPATFFDSAADCGSSELAPYLKTMSCNRRTGLPYTYETDATGCVWFKLYATLNITSDTQILPTPITVGSQSYNYGVSSPNVSVGDSNHTTGTITHYYYCSSVENGVGNCTEVPAGKTCSPIFTDGNCSFSCSSAGSCH